MHLTDLVVNVRVWWIMETQTNPACTVVVVFFSSLVRILGECLNIFFGGWVGGGGVEISSSRLIPLFIPGSVHSGSAS